MGFIRQIQNFSDSATFRFGQPRRNRKTRHAVAFSVGRLRADWAYIGGDGRLDEARCPLDFRFSCSHKGPHISPIRVCRPPRTVGAPSAAGFVAPVVRFLSVHFVPLSVIPTIPPPSLFLPLSLSLSLSHTPIFVPLRSPLLVAFKVGAPRAPENFLIDPRTSCALYSTCDSSSPLLISSPLPPRHGGELVIVPTTEPRYQRCLRFHRRRSNPANSPWQIWARGTTEINVTNKISE